MTTTEAMRLFRRELRKFAATFPDLDDAELEILDQKCISPGKCKFRNLAYADLDEMRVVLVRRALRLSKENVVGLLRHELGHLAAESSTWWNGEIRLSGQEQLADDIAEIVTGRRISYDEKNVQTTGVGRYPRPRYLHK